MKRSRTSLFKLPVCLAVAIWALPLAIRIASAGDKPFNGPANWGGSGLFEIPNARVLDDGDMRIEYAHIDPYRQLVRPAAPMIATSPERETPLPKLSF